MLKLINPRGGETWVHESRLDEYLARGFKFAAPPMPAPPEPKAVSKSDTPKKTAKKAR